MRRGEQRERLLSELEIVMRSGLAYAEELAQKAKSDPTQLIVIARAFSMAKRFSFSAGREPTSGQISVYIRKGQIALGRSPDAEEILRIVDRLLDFKWNTVEPSEIERWVLRKMGEDLRNSLDKLIDKR